MYIPANSNTVQEKLSFFPNSPQEKVVNSIVRALDEPGDKEELFGELFSIIPIHIMCFWEGQQITAEIRWHPAGVAT